MTELDAGLFWISVSASLIGIDLAFVAIGFTISVWWQNNALNQRFTESLTRIDEKSASTQGQIGSMVNRVVDTFLDIKSGQVSPVSSFTADAVQASEGGEAVLPAYGDLRQELANISRAVEEIKLRQRVGSFDDIRRWAIGDTVEIRGLATNEVFNGRVASIISFASRNHYKLLLPDDEETVILHESYLYPVVPVDAG